MQSLEGNQITSVLRPIELAPLPRLPMVSVLMSNYNYASYIGDAIESVVNQTYPYFELIVCDDGSSDDSVAVIKRYLKDARVQLLKKENGGQATGFNASFAASRGRIVCFLDADDLYLPEKLASIVEQMLANGDCGCVLNPSLRVDKHLRPRGALPLLARFPSGWRGPDALKAGGILPYMPGTPGLNLRREIAEAVFPLPVVQPLNRFPDMVIWRLAPLLCRMAVVYEPLAKIRLHDSNTYQQHRITGDSITRELEICKELWEEQHRRLRQIDPSLPDSLAPLDAAPSILMGKYIRARLSRGQEQRFHRHRLLAGMREQGDPLWRRAFWRGADALPLSVFEAVINLAFTQNRLKATILKVKYFKHCGRCLQRRPTTSGT